LSKKKSEKKISTLNISMKIIKKLISIMHIMGYYKNRWKIKKEFKTKSTSSKKNYKMNRRYY
jgi:hypothetical protein